MVEDDISLGIVVSDQLRADGYAVTLCENGAEALRRFQEEPYHLCIFDVMLPVKDGFTLARDIRKQNSEIPILFLSARSRTEDKIEGFNAGADDYLTKPFSAEELQLRVKALLKRVKLQPDTPEQKVVKIGLYTFDTENFTLQSPTQLITLTKKEAMILRTLFKFKNQLIPRDVILNSVWGQDDYFVGRSLDVFITKLRKYLKEDSSIQINNVHGVGFKFECQEWAPTSFTSKRAPKSAVLLFHKTVSCSHTKTKPEKLTSMERSSLWWYKLYFVKQISIFKIFRQLVTVPGQDLTPVCALGSLPQKDSVLHFQFH